MKDKEESIPFYLGERKEEPPKTEDTEPGPRISYGGAMPELLEHYQPEQRTNADLEKARILMDKYEKKSMINRRILYLERRRQELTGYLIDFERKRRKESFLSFFMSSRSPRSREHEEELEEIMIEHASLESEKEALVKEIREMEGRSTCQS
ncbi:MAG: hypothetical protein IK115_00535 [Lachnospiraceae bacterium]|nr:hypothetical protein [Lachnospiraceae bacterium]